MVLGNNHVSKSTRNQITFYLPFDYQTRSGHSETPKIFWKFIAILFANMSKLAFELKDDVKSERNWT